MFGLFKDKTFAAACTGKLKKLEEVNDEAIASKALGNGFAIEPIDNNIYSPVDGSIEFVFKTKHAIGFKSTGGISVLMHIGVDTVELNGEGFDIKVNNGDKVKQGDLIGTVDFEGIKDKVKSVDVIILLPEGGNLDITKKDLNVNAKETGFVRYSYE